MPPADKRRDKARSLEQKGQYKEALAVYQELIETPDADEPDLALWNKVGDLYLRVGQTGQAVTAFERAADEYSAAGLANNAIALCSKILRIAPERTEVYRKLGRIYAQKGFLPDARQNFLRYAERIQAAGDLNETFAALAEFADLFPSDLEVRRDLVRRLRAQGRDAEAAEQARRGLAQKNGSADPALTAELRAELRELAPDEVMDDDLPVATRADTSSAIPLLDDDWGAPAPPVPAPIVTRPASPPAPGTLPGFELSPALADSGPPNSPADRGPVLDAAIDFGPIVPLEGLESSDFGRAEPPGPPVATPTPRERDGGNEPGGDLALDADLEIDHEPESEPLPLLGTSSADADEVDLAESTARGHVEAAPPTAGEDPGSGDLPLLAGSTPDAPAPPPAGTGAGELELLTQDVARNPEDRPLRDRLTGRLRRLGRHEEADAVMVSAHRALADAGEYAEALVVARELASGRPGDFALYQTMVEYAYHAGDTGSQVQAYLALAAQLQRTADPAKARIVYAKVLELDPTNAEARRVLGPAATAPPAPKAAPPQPPPTAPRAPAPPASGSAPPGPTERSSGEYVDLSALIFDDEPREATTRFTVDAEPPSGNEDEDFAEMLSLFRQKVTEHIGTEDGSSHYDLGLAFKEMGLLDEAISQFQLALRGGANEVATLEMMGQCFMDQGQLSLAQRVFEQAMRAPRATEMDLLNVCYDLARCEEALGRPERARELLERVVALDIEFRDASERLAMLRRG